jgi:hypothetical protein
MKNDNITQLDFNQYDRRTFDEQNDARRVVLVGANDLKVEAKEINIDTKELASNIKENMKEIVDKLNDKLNNKEKEIIIEKIEVPTIIKETEIKTVEIPKIITEIQYKEVHVPIIQEKIKEVEVTKYVEIPKIVYADRVLKLPKLVIIGFIVQSITLLGILISIIKHLK